MELPSRLAHAVINEAYKILHHNAPVIETFTIAPRPRGGFTLTGPNLRWPLWYATVESAMSYAQIRGATSGGIVEVVDAEGNPLRSEPIERGMAWLRNVTRPRWRKKVQGSASSSRMPNVQERP